METVLGKLPGNPDKTLKYLEYVSKYSFYLGLLIELTIVILEKSEYTIQYGGQWFRLTFVLFGISMITAKHSIRQWLFFFLFAFMGGISYWKTGRNEVLRAVVFIWSCWGKDMKKVLKYTFWYTLAGCTVIFLLSVFGVYGKVYLEEVFRTDVPWTPGEVERRYCFGMGHPNSFHCMVLVLTWLGTYCYHEKIKWYGYVLMGAFHVVVFYFTDSRTGLLMSAGSIGLFVIVKCSKFLQEKIWIYLIGIFTVTAAVGFSVFMAKYSVFHPFLAKLDGLLSNRILNLYYHSVNHEGMLNTWSLWSVEKNNWYFDLGIIRMFYWFGIIPAVVYFAAQCRLLWCSFKHKDFMLAAIMIAITIYSIFEAHFVSDYLGRNYILFFFGMYLSDMLGENPSRVNIRRENGKTTSD